MQQPAIIVMTKVPTPGSVKTRLRPFLTSEQASSLAACFLKDTVSNALKVTPNVIAAFYPPERRKEIEAIIPDEVVLIEQRGSGLGEKLEAALNDVEALGFSPIMTLGSDSPSLPHEILKTAIESFREPETDFLLGETQDGGFYLIGLRKMTPGIFHGITWSSQNVFRETIANAKRIGLSNRLELPVWYDVDLPEDLIMLHDKAIADPKMREQIPATFDWLMSNQSVFK